MIIINNKFDNKCYITREKTCNLFPDEIAQHRIRQKKAGFRLIVGYGGTVPFRLPAGFLRRVFKKIHLAIGAGGFGWRSGLALPG